MRLFIALPLAPEVERQLGRLIGLLKPRTDVVRWVAPQNIHLTVRFLGDTDEKLVKDINRAIDEVAAEHQKIETVFELVGAFPNLRRPRIFWVGSSDPMEEASKIARQIEHRMRGLGFEKEKKGFKPHLTLGRVRQGKRADELADYLASFKLDPIPVELDRLTLFKSELTPKGSIYTRLHESKLGEARFSG
jgi:2'-5' RNA ligase